MKKNEYIIETSVPVRVCNLCGREISLKGPCWEVVMADPAGAGSVLYFHENCTRLILSYSAILRGFSPTKTDEAFSTLDPRNAED